MKKNRKSIKLFIVILGVLFIIHCMICFSTVMLREKVITQNKIIEIKRKSPITYNVVDLVNVLRASNNIIVSLDIEDGIVYKNELIINKSNIDSGKTYKVEYTMNDSDNIEETIDSDSSLELPYVEGKNEVNLNVYADSELIQTINETVYYIKPYEKQFLDELKKEAIVHSAVKWEGSGENKVNTANPELASKLIKSVGANWVRTYVGRGYNNKISGKEAGWAAYRAYTGEIYCLEDDSYDFSQYDPWFNAMNNRGLKIASGIWGAASVEDWKNGILATEANKNLVDFSILPKVNNEEEMKTMTKYLDILMDRYRTVEKWDIMAEANQDSVVLQKSAYVEKEDLKWYNKLLNEASKIGKKYNKTIVSQPSSTPDSNGTNNGDNGINGGGQRIMAETFWKYMMENEDELGFYNDYELAFNIYTWVVDKNSGLYTRLKNITNSINDLGGFFIKHISETGYSSSSAGDESKLLTEDELREEQAKKLVQLNVILDRFGVDYRALYDLRDDGTNIQDAESNFGIVNHDYKPKASYYSMKNYYTNTNGAEYIGRLELTSDKDYMIPTSKCIIPVYQNESREEITKFYDSVQNPYIEANVYDKDGEALIIMWAAKNKNDGWNTGKFVIDYDTTKFKAYDLYGNEIPNTNGKLTITFSPVYLKCIDDNFKKRVFYTAIRDSVIKPDANKTYENKSYDEFVNKYGDILPDEAITEINSIRDSLNLIAIHGECTPEAAINIFNKHYDIGKMILEKAQKGKLKKEKQELSALLSGLDEIGESLEDLVTVTCTDLSSAKLSETKQKQDNLKNTIENYENIDARYPERILTISNNLYEYSEYINSLTETNPIKNGLIISNSLHAYKLAEYAEDFYNIYISEAGKNGELVIYANELIPNSKAEEDMSSNTQKLQELIDRASELGGGIVHIKSGTYYFCSAGAFEDDTKNMHRGNYVIICRNNVTVEGEGIDNTILKPYGKAEHGINMFFWDTLHCWEELNANKLEYIDNADFKNFTINSEEEEYIDTEKYNAMGKGFMMTPIKNCDWNNVKVENSDGTGFGVDLPVNCSMTNCIALSCGKAAKRDSIGASGFGIGTGLTDEESIIIQNCESYRK